MRGFEHNGTRWCLKTRTVRSNPSVDACLCDTVLLPASPLISVVLIKEQLGKYVVSNLSLATAEALVRVKLEFEKKLREGIFARSPQCFIKRA
jgi:hypothetical protein